MKYLITGLGNTGEWYVHTRHNIGFMVLDQLAASHDASFTEGKLGMITTCKYRGHTLHLLKPTTYMNFSGKSVRYWLGQLKIPVEQSLTVVDDLALPFGKLRMRAKGATAGHNGLKSVEKYLATQAYPRLRVGIGNNFLKGYQADYVLKPFTMEERPKVPSFIDQACQMVLSFCSIGIERTMERCNSAAPQAEP